MDSSRGGPLSTLILMLPLIVVPALVVMRPSEQDSGFSSNDLAASVDDEFGTDGEGLESMFGPESDFADSEAPQRSAEMGLLEMPLSDFESSPEETARDSRGSERTPNRASDSSTGRRIPDLSQWGVTRSIWFTPGNPDQIGFAAFVPFRNGRVRYRFAAIGTSDDEVVEDVIRQIKEWQPQSTGTPALKED